MNRRDFIGKSALGAGAITVIPRHVMGGTGFLASGDRINIGFIGTGKQSLGLMKSITGCPETMVLAACDVDKKKLARFKSAAENVNAEKLNGGNQAVDTYENYRELLERKDIDAVVIATPDHWHAMIAIDAAKAGKDIYCEKPMALTVAEGRAMVLAARKYDRVFQTGNMQRSWRNFRHACELPAEPVPDYLNWDQWVGPSMFRNYSPVLAPPIEDTIWPMWRQYRDFGGGMITDWGAHMFDIGQWGLGMDKSGPVEFIPPEKSAKRGLQMKYANGVVMNHKDWGEFNAVQFIGSEGKIEVSRSFYRSDITGLHEVELKGSDKPLYHSDNHYQD